MLLILLTVVLAAALGSWLGADIERGGERVKVADLAKL